MDDGFGRTAEGWLIALEGLRNPVLDAVFLAFTGLGVEGFLIPFVAIGYWAFERKTFARAAAMLIAAGFLNTWLKGYFQIPRPDVVAHVHEAGGWSFPSGHAQVASALWWGLAWMAHRVGRSSLALGLVALGFAVAASRPYLGVHYVHDVAVGLLLGALQLPLLILWVRREPELSVGWALAMGAGLLTWVLLGLDPSVAGTGAALGGAGFGLAVGLGLGGIPPVPPRGRQRAGLILVGLVGVITIKIGLGSGLKAVGLGDVLVAGFLRYAMLGYFIAHGAPRLWGALARSRSRAGGAAARA